MCHSSYAVSIVCSCSIHCTGIGSSVGIGLSQFNVVHFPLSYRQTTEQKNTTSMSIFIFLFHVCDQLCSVSPYSFVHKINLMLSPVRKCKFFDINKNKAFFVFHGRLFLCAFISMVSPCSRESGILRNGQTNKKKKSNQFQTYLFGLYSKLSLSH